MRYFFNTFDSFWSQNPGILYALAILLGVYTALEPSPILLLPLITLGLSLRNLSIRLGFTFLLFLASFTLVQSSYQFPEEISEGVAEFDISSLSYDSHHFGNYWKYRGVIRQFIPNGEDQSIAKNIPCVITVSGKNGIDRPPANCAYWIPGKLKPIGNHYYVLSIQVAEPWIPIPGSWSFAEWRLRTKQVVSSYIQKKIKGRRNADFLAGLATGNFEDRLMSHEFVRFGLQHIMAISGFHFAILAGILSCLFRYFFSQRKMSLILIFLLSSYFLFLGPAPSILRAWVSILIALFSTFLEKESKGINSLGIAILVICLFDPLLVQSIGFQFSVATTAAILILFPTMNRMTQKIWRCRPLSQMIQMDGMNQHGYCILACFRGAFALTLAVNLIALPMTLFFFQKFPWMSLLYNLFFPFMVSISMFLLLVGSGVGLILPFLGNGIHWLNSIFTHFSLNLIYHMPTTVDYVLRTEPFSAGIIIAYITVIFIIGIFLQAKQEEELPFRFI